MPERGVRQVVPVDGTEEILHPAVGIVFEQIPVELTGKIPLVPLAQLRAHEGELLARVREHIDHEAAHARELPPLVARHLAAQTALHVHHLVVRDGQHEVFGKGVHQREGEVLMMELAEPRVELEVVAHIVHPAHVPLEVEAQPAVRDRIGHERPRGRFLRHHHHVRINGKGSGVERAQEVDGLQVLVAAVFVRHPLARFAPVVEV